MQWTVVAQYTAGGAVLLLLAGPLGTRAGLWTYRIGLPLFGLGALLAAAAVVVTVVGGLRSPVINDISTDSDEVTAEQRRAYPDIQPLVLPMPPPAAFERALAVAMGLGWDIVTRDPAGGRIDAVDTTFWFGFKDDIVVRVREAGSGSRIDVRSKSRVGRGDIGTNARRVRTFLSLVRQAR